MVKGIPWPTVKTTNYHNNRIVHLTKHGVYNYAMLKPLNHEDAKDRSMIMPLPPPDPSRVIGANPNLGAPYIHPIYGTIGITPQKAQPAVFTLPAGYEVDVDMFTVPTHGWSPGGCDHDFKEYQGFTESYRYCIKCDHKVEQ